MEYKYKAGDMVNTEKYGIVKVLVVDNQDTKLPYLVELLNEPRIMQCWVAQEDIIGATTTNETIEDNEIKIDDIVEYVGNNVVRQGTYWKVLNFLDKNRAIEVFGLMDKETKIFKTKDFVKSNKTTDQIKQMKSTLTMDDIMLSILTSPAIVKEKMKELSKQIDVALDNNDKELFIKLTNQLLQLQH